MAPAALAGLLGALVAFDADPAGSKEGAGMEERRWYEAETLMADLTSHHHEIPGASEEEIDQWMRNHYPDAVAILVRETARQVQIGRYMRRTQGGV